MAEAVVSFAVERLGELLISEAKLLHGVSDQINNIQRELERMQCFLEEADKKQNRDKRVRKWVEEMRELAFKIEDVIETFALEVMAKKQKSGFKEILLRFSCILNEGVNRHNIAMEINAIKTQLTNLTESLPRYGVTEGLKEGETSRSLVDLKSRRTYSHDVEKDFVGMENEIKQLITHLKNEDNGCEVVSICGMGGLGKTTLAKTLYNHAEVKAHFQAFAWVCITQQFEREKVLKEVLKELLPADRKEEVSKMDDAKLVKELYKVQQEKKCLIVIDDIWTPASWNSIEPAFPVGDTTSGSKILLTTRNETVVKIAFIYRIPGLSDDQGWQLLSKKAGILSDSAKREMEKIGRKMVKRCKGLPLAISTLGGLLKGKSLREWEKISRDVSFYLAKGESVANDDECYSVEQVLGLSYHSLPPRLRHCFLFFANYKEDEIISTMELYKYWVAEGLISVEDKAEGEMIFDVAERYLDELVHRSLVQIESTEGAYGLKYKNCHVHDLIRELCLSKAEEENFIKVIHLQHEPVHESKASIVRRLCIHSHDDGDVSKLRHYDQHVISHVRSLRIFGLWLGNRTFRVWPDKILDLKKFKLLRVLIANRYKFSKENMRSISKLVYLKHLCLRYCKLEELPTSIGNLRNLETLDLSDCDCNRIPNVLWKLKHLKHLYLPDDLEGMVEKLKFEGLNDLELIYNYDSLYCDSNDLIRLCKLKAFSGKLRVEDDLTENIIDFIKHRELRCSYLDIEGEGRGLCLVSLLDCGFIDIMIIKTRICKFPKEYYNTHLSGRLSWLRLDNCRIEEDPMILLEKLPNLCALYFDDNAYLGEEMVCSATGFPQLKYLCLAGLPGLKKWILDEGAMPNILSIYINKCDELEMLPEGLIHLTTLKSIKFCFMPTTFNDRIKVVDGVEGEDMCKVRHIRDVSIYPE